jgi:ribosomal protein S27AE
MNVIPFLNDDLRETLYAKHLEIPQYRVIKRKQMRKFTPIICKKCFSFTIGLEHKRLGYYCGACGINEYRKVKRINNIYYKLSILNKKYDLKKVLNRKILQRLISLE